MVTPVSAIGQSHIQQRLGAQAGVFQLPLDTEQMRNLLTTKKSPLAQAQENSRLLSSWVKQETSKSGHPSPPCGPRAACMRALNGECAFLPALEIGACLFLLKDIV